MQALLAQADLLRRQACTEAQEGGSDTRLILKEALNILQVLRWQQRQHASWPEPERYAVPCMTADCSM